MEIHIKLKQLLQNIENEDTYTIIGSIVIEREKAYCVKTIDKKKIWIPKSLTIVENDTFTIPLWLADVKGLLKPIIDLNDIFKCLFQYIDPDKIKSKQHKNLYYDFKKLIELEELKNDTEKKKQEIISSLIYKPIGG